MEASRPSQPTARGALEGIRVLDLAGTVAAGYCGKLFADHGADVLLVEPPAGFPTRRLPPFAPGAPAPESSGMHAYLGANKRSVVCDDPALLARGAALAIDDRVGDERPLDLASLAAVSTGTGARGSCARTGADSTLRALLRSLRSLRKARRVPVPETGHACPHARDAAPRCGPAAACPAPLDLLLWS